MNIADAQREVRIAFLGGFAGQLSACVFWLASAMLAVLVSPRAAILELVFGGMLIFPLTQLLLRMMGRRGLIPGHPLNGLARQIAFMVPFSLPLVGAAALHHLFWFYPAFMIVIGVHYLPFMFLYGMRLFGILAGLLISAGLAIGLWGPPIFGLGAWITASLLLLFAFLGRRFAEEPTAKSAATLAAG